MGMCSRINDVSCNRVGYPTNIVPNCVHACVRERGSVYVSVFVLICVCLFNFPKLNVNGNYTVSRMQNKGRKKVS